MYVNISYDEDFTELMIHLKAKYGFKMFEIDGIDGQLDINKYSREFFSTTAVTDVSVDSNSNVSTKDIIIYNAELPKPYFRLNAYYLIWRKLRQLYGHLEANRIIEMQLSGDIYINDFHGVSAPYSYHPHTVILISLNEEIKSITMECLFDELSFFISDKTDTEEYIDLTQQNIKIYDKGGWVKLNRILRHKSHSDLIRIETKKGGVCVVTEDHPVILDDGSELLAKDVTLDTSLMHGDRYVYLDEMVNKNNYESYIIGAMIGDGFVSNNKCTFVQKDIENTHFYKIIKETYDNVNTTKSNAVTFGDITLAKKYKKLIGHLALGKHLPYDCFSWSYEDRLALLCGIIDTDGTINKRSGIVSIRMISYAAIQQISELAYSLGCSNIRTSLVNKQITKNSFKSNYLLYRSSFRIKDERFNDWSKKVRNNKDIAFKVAGNDGRWGSNKVNKIDIMDWKNNWVYDVTTETGTFYSNGLIVHNCFNFSTYDIALEGLTMVNKIRSVAPKYLYAFKSQLEQFVTIASNSTLGATGLADLFIVMAYYVDRIMENKSDAGFRFATIADCWKYVKENIVSFIYTINQPMRVSQSPFTNVSLFDDVFLESLASEYKFPDGNSPSVSTIKKIQEIYVDTVNEELKRTPVTFPVKKLAA